MATQISKKRKFVHAKHNEILTRELVEDGYTASSLSEVDYISQLPDCLLVLILSRVPTEEAIRMSVASKRWEHVWKKLPHLVLNTRRRSINPRILSLSDDSNPDAELTRVINNHYGHLESCVITHSSNKKGEHGLLETWIQNTVETRNLTLANRNIRSLCSFPLDFFSHSKLSSLSLKRYTLSISIPNFFQNNKNWPNIKTLKLVSIYAPHVGVFENVFASCPSLEILLLKNIACTGTCLKRSLEIKNSKLKFFELYSICCIDEVIVSAPNLDILVVKDAFFSKDIPIDRKFLLRSPNLQFNLNSRNSCLNIVYNISKEKNNWHEELVNRIGELRRESYLSLSVSVDLMNETEVERLHQVMSLSDMYDGLRDFSIKFKGNNSPNPSEEFESWQKKCWVVEDRTYQRMWVYNFKGSKEEIAFVSCLLRQRKVEIRIMINSKSFSAYNKSNVEAALAKLLLEVQSEGQEKVTIKYFRD